jgi:hypothetical protein
MLHTAYLPDIACPTYTELAKKYAGDIVQGWGISSSLMAI